MRGITDTVKHLLIINGILFFASNLYGVFFNDLMALHFFVNPAFQFWQPITHMFMHGNFNHILFNMLGLWMFGSPLEQLWGRKKFLFYYFSAGLGAAALQLFAYSVTFSKCSFAHHIFTFFSNQSKVLCSHFNSWRFIFRIHFLFYGASCPFCSCGWSYYRFCDDDVLEAQSIQSKPLELR